MIEQPSTRQMQAQTTNASNNPATDPLHGVSAPMQVMNSTVTGGTNMGSGALLMQTPGGLPPLFSIATGVSSSLASKMYECAFARSLTFGTNTTAGTVLDEVLFDPWSATNVNGAALLYGQHHKHFTGAINLTYEVVTNATMMGRILVVFIPETFGSDYVVTRQNAFKHEHIILDVSVSGKGTITLKPTTTSDFVVKKNSGKFYGKVVVLAQTDIVNTYGATVNVPMNVYSELAPGSMYTAIDDSVDHTCPDPVNQVFRKSRPFSQRTWALH
ncbi:hypothetical protein 2 [Beihai picorna-like virus 83]|uniref:hypothetical protein 2 n=1 Tax=Beihai picorna-like virus 83 TaxID=1922631 RepID=UPI00090AE7B8|nr:hypothetical protein 2 [Beihai picorna-like virus 83]APG76904.1 hypothetical protein 2 [Beihai picorna-like virus 83]